MKILAATILTMMTMTATSMHTHDSMARNHHPLYLALDPSHAVEHSHKKREPSKWLNVPIVSVVGARIVPKAIHGDSSRMS